MRRNAPRARSPSKAPLPSELEPARCSRLLRALADPDRLRIVQCLRSGPKDVTALTKLLRTPLANVSHHLKVLRRFRFVLGEKDGRHVVYSLNPGMVPREQNWIDLSCCRLVLGSPRISIARHSKAR